MDSDIRNILIGVFTNILSEIVIYFGKKSGELLIGRDMLEQRQLKTTALSPILEDAINEIFENLEWNDLQNANDIYLFLGSPEIHEIIRQLYSTYLVRKSESSNLKSIYEEFTSLLGIFTGLKLSELEKTAKILFTLLTHTSNKSLNLAIDRGVLSAHEANSACQVPVL